MAVATSTSSFLSSVSTTWRYILVDRKTNQDYKQSAVQLNGADSHLQRVTTIPEAAHIQLRRGPPDDEQGLLLETCTGV